MWYAITALTVIGIAACLGYVAGRLHNDRGKKPRPLPPHLRHPQMGDKDYLIDGGTAG